MIGSLIALAALGRQIGCRSDGPDVRAILSKIDRFAAALARGDADAAVATYADDLVYMPDGVATDHGKQGTRDAFRAMVAKYRVNLSVKTDEVTVCGAVAYDLGSVRLVLTPKAGGEPRTIEKRFLELWRKDKTGWRVARVMNNAVPK
jgi:ketosteroid isomerase-like protein